MATAMFWMGIVTALLGALCVFSRISPANRFMGFLAMGAGLFGLVGSGILNALAANREPVETDGMPYTSPLENFHAGDVFAIAAFVLTILVVAIVCMRESTAKTARYYDQPYSPDELAADLNRIENEDTRNRVKAMIREDAQTAPITRARFDDLADKAENDRAAAAQIAALDPTMKTS